MKLKLLLSMLFSCYISITYSQNNQKSSTFEYINFSSVSITKNTESYFSKKSKEEFNRNDSFGLGINTIHGVKFFGIIALSAGIAIDWNINKTFISTPIIYDVRFFANRNKGENLFFYLQTGQNLKLLNSVNGNGFSAKLGIGAIFDVSKKVSYFVDVYKKGKEIQLENFETNGYYRANGFGISLGVIF